MAKKVTKKELKAMNVMNLVERVIEATNDAHEFVTADARPYIAELCNRLGITELQASILSVFVDQCDDSRIRLRDIARHFDMRTVAILAVADVFDELLRLGVIVRRVDSDGECTYRLPPAVLNGLRHGQMPEKENIENLSALDFIDAVDAMLKLTRDDEMSDDELESRLEELIEKNQQLHLARQLHAMSLPFNDLKLFLVMSMTFINNHDDRQQRGDFDDYFPRGVYRRHAQRLEAGDHILMRARLVEYACDEGKADPTVWKLTNYAKQEIYAELNLKVATNVRANMTHFEDVQPKELFYNTRVTRQVEQLEALLEPQRMNDVLRRLSDRGLRKGFTCIFYGAPGTGKTETVLQLARRTKRDIMMVDVPSIRSKWVGETEQNVKALFDRYRKAVESCKSSDGSFNHAMPILLFNEADALLNRRNEGGVNAVDKMENAMQNIILQEMENLEGIMIATTNLTGNLDPAFERRFLYKLEFDRPMPNERRHIWKAMMPDLSDKQALTLAERFDFSGGQIENIARKRIVDDILEGRDTVSLEAIISNCETERLNNTKVKRVGFNAA